MKAKTPMQLAREFDRLDLCGSPIRLCGGRAYGSVATGWYYSLEGSSLCGSAKDNVHGPFATKMEALQELADYAANVALRVGHA